MKLLQITLAGFVGLAGLTAASERHGELKARWVDDAAHIYR
jgi:hypothetical protein